MGDERPQPYRTLKSNLARNLAAIDRTLTAHVYVLTVLYPVGVVGSYVPGAPAPFGVYGLVTVAALAGGLLLQRLWPSVLEQLWPLGAVVLVSYAVLQGQLGFPPAYDQQSWTLVGESGLLYLLVVAIALPLSRLL